MSYQQSLAILRQLESNGRLRALLSLDKGQPLSIWMTDGEEAPKPPRPCFDVF